MNRKLNGGYKVKLSKRSLVYVTLLLLYFRPAPYVVGSLIYSIGTYLLLFEFFFLLTMAVLNYKQGKYKPSKTSCMLLILFFWCLIGSTSINWIVGNKVSYNDAGIYFIVAAGFILLVDMGLFKNPKCFLGCFTMVGTTVCFINALTIFIYSSSGGMNLTAILSGGHTTYYFLAEDNASIFWTWPVMVVTWIYYFRFFRSKKMLVWNIFYTIVTCISYIYVWSVTATLGTFALAYIVFIYRKAGINKKKKNKSLGIKIVKFNFYWIIATIINYLVAISQTWTKFADLLTKYFNKSANASGRTYIWRKSIEYIKQAWFIGYGQEAAEVTMSKLRINHTHNILLETLYRGGFIAIIIWGMIFLNLGNVSKNVNNKIYSFLMLSIFLFLIMTSIDFAFYRYPYLILLLIMSHTELFEKEIKSFW